MPCTTQHNRRRIRRRKVARKCIESYINALDRGQELQNAKKWPKSFREMKEFVLFLLSLAVWCNAKANNFLSCPNPKSFAVHFKKADESRWKEQKILNTNSKKRNVLIIQQKKTWFCFYWEPVRKPKFFFHRYLSGSLLARMFFFDSCVWRQLRSSHIFLYW